jgi:hypothetical protein
MSEKVEFSGDVGQAVMGDVKEAPRLSNVVNLNLSEVKKEVQLITDYQRKRINLLVKEWAAICGDKELEIYKVFIADFGLRKFRELPIEHYLSVKATLEGWIASGSKSPTVPVTPTVEPKITAHSDHTPCLACAEKDASFARAQRTNFAQWVLIAILTGSCAWLLYKMPVTPDVSQDDKGQCYFEGKPYSAGSTIKAGGGSLRECIADAASHAMTWTKLR